MTRTYFSATSPRPGDRLRPGHLPPGADALFLHSLAAKASPLVIVCADPRDAQRLVDEIGWFAPGLRVHLFPDWETLPYDHFSPHQDLVSERLATLYALMQRQCDVLVCPLSTSLYRLPPVAFLAAHTFLLKKGERIDVNALRGQLALAGYDHVAQVLRPGEFSLRGSIIDLYPTGSPVPYRIDLFDDEIDTIRTFDVDTQRSIYPVTEIRLLPAREFSLTDDAVAGFRGRFRETFDRDPSRCPIYRNVSDGLAPGGIEYYLPLFFDETATLFDYLAETATLALVGNIEAAIAAFWQETGERYRLLSSDPERPCLAPARLFLDAEAFFLRAGAHGVARLPAEGPMAEGVERLPELTVDRKAANPVERLAGYAATFSGQVVALAESAGRRDTMQILLEEHGLKPKPLAAFAELDEAGDGFYLGVAPLGGGFVLPGHRLAIVTERELYAVDVQRSRGRRQRQGTSPDAMLRDLSEIKVGDPVVHEQHGIGLYLGLQSMDLGEGDNEFLTLEFQGGDKLYVPVSQLQVISRYFGANEGGVNLSRLGGGQWEKAKRKALKQARDTAAELLNLYALRATRKGLAAQVTLHDIDAFAAGFGFDETVDQMAAIEAVQADLLSDRPMDRLVCGDVGFGKTEVALRAAFISVISGRQVAVLTPTTLLAEQHFQTFSDRFSDWPVKIAELSRFRSAKEQTDALKRLGTGDVDIIIGTHRLLQKDVAFKNLGLVIIDEEHRFGVRQKERMKALRAEVNVLTLTATPIPRTLAMAMEGLREFSVIATAPQRRLAIKTFASSPSDGIIREAVLRELKRGGQVYFVHNQVENIVATGEKLQALLPEARIQIAHGQMHERELERVMRDFYQQRFNVLLCTTIIETGIDNPAANTILINRADKFGLAQLHQLRGRVGRSHHQAYAYLLVPEQTTPAAKKRLEAIQNLEDLGSGFYLAMHDLEIRGAGEVLGESQSGEMQEVGFSMYTEMLARAVDSLKAGREPELESIEMARSATEVNLHTPALLPNDYCPDVHERLMLYKRLAHCASEDELTAVKEEIIDRFGSLPDPARALIDAHSLRLAAAHLALAKIDAHSDGITLQFRRDTPLQPTKVFALIGKRKDLKFAGADRLRLSGKLENLAGRVQVARQLLRTLGEEAV